MALETPKASEAPAKPDAPRDNPARDEASIAAERQARQQAEAASRAEEWSPAAEEALLAELDQLDSGDDDPFLDTALDDFLADLEAEEAAGSIDPEARRAELAAWIAEAWPDRQPIKRAAALAQAYEADIQAIDPAYDAFEDPDIGDVLSASLALEETAAASRQETQANQVKEAAVEEKTALAERSEAVSREPIHLTSEGGERGALEREAQASDAKNEAIVARRAEAAQELDSLDALVDPYNEMLPRFGQTETLRRLMVQTTAPEVKGRLSAILATLARVETAIPAADRPALARILAQTPLNLAGASVIDSFGAVLQAVDADETLSAEAKTAVRAAVLGETYIHRGSQLREAATEMVPDPKTGVLAPRYTAEHPRDVRPGVTAYTKTGAEVLVRLDLPGHPSVTRDVSGWRDEDIGLLAEAMGFAAGLERFGATAFVEDVYKIDFSLLGSSAFDRQSLIQIRQMISALVGSFEGYDGDIFDVREKLGLLRHQARLLNPAGTATGFENDRAATLSAVRRLGLQDEEGRPNFAVLKAFGAFAQATYLTADADHHTVQAHLHGRFPQAVTPPDQAKSAA